MAVEDPPEPYPQVIPRPAEVAPGDPAPWASLAPERRRSLGLARVLTALEGAGLTGSRPPRHDGLAEAFDPPSPAEVGVASAVLVALFEEDGETRVVLTRRSAELRSHTGQVSFPGGRLDPGEDPPRGALREAAEEVGIHPSGVQVVGWLHPVATFTSGSLITPVVGALERRPVLVANPSEVARAFDVSLAALVADGAFHEERWTVPSPAGRPGRTRPLWFFDVEGETVWGATARMLYELLSVALGVAPARM